MQICSIDFEFKPSTTTKYYDVVCLACKTPEEEKSFWLYSRQQEVKKAYEYLNNLAKQGFVFTGHFIYAEVTSCLSLGWNIDDWNFIDGQVEAKLLQNSDNKSKRPMLSLADLCKTFKIYDYFEGNYKDKMRKMVLNNKEYSETMQKEILQYCQIDANNSYKLLNEVLIHSIEKLFRSFYDYGKGIIRGNYVKAAAHASWVGIPIKQDYLNDIAKNYRKLIKHFIDEADDLVSRCFVANGNGFTLKADLLAESIEMAGLSRKWKISEKSGKYSTESKYLDSIRHIHTFCESLRHTLKRIQSLKYLKPDPIKMKAQEISKNKQIAFKGSSGLVNEKGILRHSLIDKVKWQCLKWPVLTSKGSPSVTSTTILTFCEEFKENYKWVKELEEDIILFEAIKYLKTKNLDDDDSFEAEGNLHNSLKQGKIHMPLGVFGTVTGRNTPRAKTFIFAQSAWQRSLVNIPKGYKLVACDYGSEEIFVGAIFHKDKKMLEAYYSKDFYLNVGVMMGKVSKEDFNTLSIEELKEKYNKERKLLKGLVLGVGYLMGPKKLGASLFPEYSEHKAEYYAKQLILKYKHTFKTFFDSGRRFIHNSKKPQILSHWGHKGLERETTANNYPIQGSSAEILHYATIKLSNKKMWDRGIYCFSLLHDGMYYIVKDDFNFEYNVKHVEKEMISAVKEVMKTEKEIRIDTEVFDSYEIFYEKDLSTIKNILNLLKANNKYGKLN